MNYIIKCTEEEYSALCIQMIELAEDYPKDKAIQYLKELVLTGRKYRKDMKTFRKSMHSTLTKIDEIIKSDHAMGRTLVSLYICCYLSYKGRTTRVTKKN